MKKLIRFLFILLFLSILAGAGYVGWRFQTNTESVYPYTYAPIQVDQSQAREAEKADILVLGDGAAVDLAPYLELFQQRTKEFLKTPPTIYNWGERGETLAHATAKVKSLKKMPTLIIYHGGLDEMNRARLLPQYLSPIIKNVEFTNNDELMSTIISFPVVSRLVYHPHPKADLSSNGTPFASNLPTRTVFKTLEILYQIYQWEAEELTNTIKIKDGRLWFIPQAYNLMERPVRSCSGTSDVKNGLLQIEELLKKRRSKEAINSLKEILKTDQSHADTYYSLGKAFLSQGNYAKAKKAFYQAMIYDCGLKRSNPLFLKILLEEVEKRNFKVFDFNRLVTSNLGRRLMFESARTPQRIYYEQLVETLIKKFKVFVKRKN